MAYIGIDKTPLPELTSQRRLRESAGILPDGSGFFTATVKTEANEEGWNKQWSDWEDRAKGMSVHVSKA